MALLAAVAVLGALLAVSAAPAAAQTVPVLVVYRPSSSSITEGADAEFVVEAHIAPSMDLTVSLTVTETGGGDHVDSDAEGQKTVVLPAGRIRVSYTVPTVDDSTAEPGSTIGLALRAEPSYSLGVSRSRSITVTDDDTPPVGVEVTIAAGSGSVVEGQNLTVTVTLASPAAGGVTFPVTVVTGTAGAADYTAPAGVVVSSGQTSGTAVFAAVDDAVDESSETLTLRLGALPTGYIAGTPSSATVTIVDGDATAVTLARAAGATLTEGDSIDYTLTLGRALIAGESLSVPLEFSTGAGVAIRNTDYMLACNENPAPAGVACSNLNSGAAMIVFTGPSAESMTITLTAVADSTTETGGETVNVGLGSLAASTLAGGAIGSDTAATAFTIVDTPPVGVEVTIAAGSGSVVEGQNLTVTVTLASPAAGGVTFPVTVVTGTAGAADYTAPAGVVVSSGQTSGTAVFAAVDDAVDESSETLTLRLGALPTGYIAGTPSSATVTIVDGDATAVTLARAAGATLTEGDSIDYTLTLGRALIAGESLSVPLEFSTGAGVAIRNTDYMLACNENPAPAGVACSNLNSGAAMIVFTGPSAESMTITLTAVADSTTETGGETVNVGLGSLAASTLAGGAIGSDTAATAFTIVDRASVMTPAVTVTQTGGTTTVAENSGTDTYTIALNAQPSANVNINIASNAPSTARIDGPDPGSTPTASETLTFTPGNYDRPRTVTVTGINDNIDNPGNRRSAVITHTVAAASAAEYRSINVVTVTVTVTDDDNPTTPPPSTSPKSEPKPAPDPKTESEPVYEDLDDTHDIHSQAVMRLVGDGLFNRLGCGERLLCPAGPMTRWQFAVLLVRLLENTDTPDTKSGTSSFGDVEAGAVWWATHVQRLAELGITRGCRSDPDLFCPQQLLTRAQAAEFIARAFDLPAAADPAGFVDMTPSHTHAAAVDALFAAGITKGCDTDPLRYCPQQAAPRQQVASLLTRAITTKHRHRQSG